jgi:outer membrane protein TolC
LIALVHVRARDDEASERQGQLLSAVADQERAARHDVAQAIAAIHARLAQIDLARRRIEFLEQHREALRRRAEAAPAASFDARKATLDLLAARQDLFHDVIEWKIAAVKLRELEGELAIECGFTAALDCGGGQRQCW